MNLGMHNSSGLPIGKPSYENIVKHIDRFGLDREAKGYNVGKVKVYKTYKQFRSDSAIEVARSYCAEDAYVRLVSKYGSHKWEDEAREDWRAEHGD